jgi:hypothetical protein
MTCLDNYRTHYCPDSGFSLVSENDAEFEVCNCFGSAMFQTAGTAVAQSEVQALLSSSLLGEQIWYRTIAALAKVCGTGKAVHTVSTAEHKPEEALVSVRKS